MNLKCFFGYHKLKRKEMKEFCKCLECTEKNMKYLISIEVEEICQICKKVIYKFNKFTPTGC